MSRSGKVASSLLRYKEPRDLTVEEVDILSHIAAPIAFDNNVDGLEIVYSNREFTAIYKGDEIETQPQEELIAMFRVYVAGLTMEDF